MKGTSWWSSDLDSVLPTQTGPLVRELSSHTPQGTAKQKVIKKRKEKKKKENKKINYMDSHSIQIFRNLLQMQSPNKSKMKQERIMKRFYTERPIQNSIQRMNTVTQEPRFSMPGNSE